MTLKLVVCTIVVSTALMRVASAAPEESLAPAEPESPAAPVVAPLSNPSSPVLSWDPAWAKSGGVNYGIIGGAVAGTIAAAIMKPLSHHNLQKPILFDDGARRTLKLSTLDAQYTARDTTDVLISLETTWPFFVDSLIVAYGTHRSPSVAWEMAVIDAEAVAITAFVQTMTANLVSRERPFAEGCGTVFPSNANDCVRNFRYRSFFSGHSAMAFTGASLVCAHRQHLELFGPKADIATCIVAYTAAAATATLRVVGDVHYASDVIVGAVVGTAIGLGVPALHYRRRNRAEGDVDVSIYPAGKGLGVAVTY